MTDGHATIGMDEAQRQRGNESWWTDNTMSYDWKEKSPHPRFSPQWYDDIDARFLHSARLYTGAANPFVEMMGLPEIAGKRVLEIGCGMGYHSELLLRAGAELTSIDLSETSVAATKKRLEVKGLSGDVRKMDAEKLDFPDSTFDEIWCWGVIHHSASTSHALKEIHRVLKPGGKARIMVYNLEGAPAYIAMIQRYSFGFWRGRSIDELLWNNADGFSARFYTRDLWTDLLSLFFEDIQIRFCGQDADVLLLPRQLRRPLLKLIPRKRQIRLAQARGSMLFSIATKPA